MLLTVYEELFVGDLVKYSENMPFALPLMKFGLVIEKIDMASSLKENLNTEYKGFMREWANYMNLREAMMLPVFTEECIEAKERILNRVITPDNITTKYLYKVLWNNGMQYIEHPEDIIPYTEI